MSVARMQRRAGVAALLLLSCEPAAQGERTFLFARGVPLLQQIRQVPTIQKPKTQRDANPNANSQQRTEARSRLRWSEDGQAITIYSEQPDSIGRRQQRSVARYTQDEDGFQLGRNAPEDSPPPSSLNGSPMRSFESQFSHVLHTTQGQESAIPRHTLVFGSDACVIVDSAFTQMREGSQIVPTNLAETHVRAYYFLSHLLGNTFVLVERETVLKQALEGSDIVTPDLQMLRIQGDPASFGNIAFVQADGKTMEGGRDKAEEKKTEDRRQKTETTTAEQDRTGKETEAKSARTVVVEDAALRTGGYAALYPDTYGAVGVFPVCSEIPIAGGKPVPLRLHLNVTGATMTFGYHLPLQALPQGTRFRQMFLLLRARPGTQSSDGFAWVQRAFGLDGSAPAYKITPELGTVTNTRYTLDMTTKTEGIVVGLSQSHLPCDLPLHVSGLSANRTTALVELPNSTTPTTRASTAVKRDSVALRNSRILQGVPASPGKLTYRVLGVHEGTAYAAINLTAEAHRVFIGHPVLCDRPELTLNVTDWSEKGVTLELHNPTQQPISAALKIHNALGTGKRNVTIPAQTSQTVLLPWR